MSLSARQRAEHKHRVWRAMQEKSKGVARADAFRKQQTLGDGRSVPIRARAAPAPENVKKMPFPNLVRARKKARSSGSALKSESAFRASGSGERRSSEAAGRIRASERRALDPALTRGRENAGSGGSIHLQGR